MCTGKIKHGIKGKIDVRSIALFRFCTKLIYEIVGLRVNYSEFYFLILNFLKIPKVMKYDFKNFINFK